MTSSAVGDIWDALAAEAVAEVEELGERQLKGMARPVVVACLKSLK